MYKHKYIGYYNSKLTSCCNCKYCYSMCINFILNYGNCYKFSCNCISCFYSVMSRTRHSTISYAQCYRHINCSYSIHN